MTIQVINAVAEFERDLLIDRTKSGLKRAKLMLRNFAGSALTDELKSEVRRLLGGSVPIVQISRQFDTTQ